MVGDLLTAVEKKTVVTRGKGSVDFFRFFHSFKNIYTTTTTTTTTIYIFFLKESLLKGRANPMG
jgi:hypothetical protein